MKILVALSFVMLALVGAAAPACAGNGGVAGRPVASTASMNPAPVNFGVTNTASRPPVRQEQGTYCRAYSRAVDKAGYRQESYGTACLQSDGSWRAVR